MLSRKLVNNLTAFIIFMAAAVVDNCSTYPVKQANQEDSLFWNNNVGNVYYVFEQVCPIKKVGTAP